MKNKPLKCFYEGETVVLNCKTGVSLLVVLNCKTGVSLDSLISRTLQS